MRFIAVMLLLASIPYAQAQRLPGVEPFLLTAAPRDLRECSKGSGTVLTISSWTTTEPAHNGRFDAVFQIESRAPKPTRMAEATIWFDDLLGRSLGGWNLDPDFRIGPGETATFTLPLGKISFGGRPLSREDLVARLCTEALLYDDGTKEEF